MGYWADAGGFGGLDMVAMGLAGAALIALASASGILRRIRDQHYRDIDLSAGYDATAGVIGATKPPL
ncbi:MAG: hypothetical protein NW203_12805 [Hyphomonadaceae bacterium]|nr:hypothetical protein [Hyphomonadaceae bacterium]